MDTDVEKLISRALKMPARDRAEIAEKLILSLNDKYDKDVEVAWQREVQKRISDIEGGRTKCIPWEEVRTSLHKDTHFSSHASTSETGLLGK